MNRKLYRDGQNHTTSLHLDFHPFFNIYTIKYSKTEEEIFKFCPQYINEFRHLDILILIGPKYMDNYPDISLGLRNQLIDSYFNRLMNEFVFVFVFVTFD